MITVHIKGGLGNQLFQYAYGRALMAKGRDVMFDISYFKRDLGYTKRSFRLEVFHLPKDVRFEERGSKQSLLVRLLNKLDGDRRIRFVPSNKEKKRGVADGDYLSEKYFSEIRESLLYELTLRDEAPLFLGYKKRIQESSNSLIVHARRTDYLQSTGFTILDKEYYQKARGLFPQKVEIFCFSDDPEWVKDLFPNEKVVVVSVQGLTDAEELVLMSYGKNFIIANSTFSWWGAWLSQAKNKVVIAPKKWFTNKSWHKANKDIIPTEWKRI